jgi:hypothetical protein
MSACSSTSSDFPASGESYDDSWFVGREEELGIIEQKVRDGLQGSFISEPIVYFWGMPGIGKSWLLKRLEQLYSSNCGSNVRGIGNVTTLTLLVDLTKAPSGSGQHPYEDVELFRYLMCEAAGCLAQGLPDLSAQIREDCPVADEVEQNSDIERLVDRFVEHLAVLSHDYVVLILFDAVECLDSRTFSWLEQNILSPLASTDRILIVATGRQANPNWDGLPVRRRLQTVKLDPLDKARSHEQILIHECAPGAPEVIYPYTLGHPYANWLFITTLAGQGVSLLSDKAVSSVLSLAVDRLLEPVGCESENNALRVLSGLRKFNTQSARVLLGEMLGNKYRSMSDGEYGHLFDSFEDRNLVDWEVARRGYAVQSAARRILQQHMRLETPHVYCQLHDCALDLYENRANLYPNKRAFLILEMLYHYAQRDFNDINGLTHDVNELISTWLQPERLSVEQAHELWRALEEDSEIHLDLPEQLYLQLLDAVQKI